jgi:hypothetical protein
MRIFAMLFVFVGGLCAQDPFEIHVYEYDPLPRGEFTYEAHTNYVVEGSKTASGPLLPMKRQFHFTSELTAGVTDWFRAAAVILTVRRPGDAWEYAGFRVLPHFYAPPSWHLPLNLGLVAEFSFQPASYAENSRTLELRTIVEKHIGRLELDANPVFTRALRGIDANAGWAFEPEGRVGWRVSSSLTPSLEYYSSWGSIGGFPPLRDQIHQLVPGADVRFRDRVMWNFGVGFGLTPQGSGLIVKSRFEVRFGEPHSRR